MPRSRVEITEKARSMWRWGFGKKQQAETDAAAEPQVSPTVSDEWSYLRDQPDYDADEMASVHGADVDAEDEADAPGLLDPSTDRPLALLAELGCGFQDLMQPAEKAGLKPSQVLGRPLLLEVNTGRTAYRKTVYGEAWIGRRDDQDGFFPEIDLSHDRGISPRHAFIRLENGAYRLRDQHTLERIWVNGAMLPAGGEVLLRSGDEIRLGVCTSIRVVDAGADDPELTAEDRLLSRMLDEALGAAPAEDAAANWAGSEGEPSASLDPADSEPFVGDLLEYTLERGGSLGLLPKEHRFPDAFYSMRPPRVDTHRRRNR